MELGSAKSRDWPALAAAALLIAAGALAYSDSFSGAFLFDDFQNIVDNPHAHSLRPPWEPMRPAPGVTVRPLVSLSFALNWAAGGQRVAGYHAVNLAIHLLAGLALFGVVRRTLRKLAGATPLAFVVALLWLVHPVQTESVTYVVQRAESMAGLFVLLTLYAVIRAEGSPRPVRWRVAAVASCALAMLSKEVSVAAPALVLLYDRAFLSASWGDAFRRKGPLYAGLAATWLIPVGLWLAIGGTPTAGLSVAGMTPATYLLTETRVIIGEYIPLCFAPTGLVIDRGGAAARGLAEVWPYAATLAALIAATVVAWRFSRPAGFIGAWFLVSLAPSSSVFPLADVSFEHRLYLALAAPVAGACVGAWWLASRAGFRKIALGVAAVALAAVVAWLGFLTWTRNQDYRSPLAIWEDAALKRPQHWRAHYNLGRALQLDGQDARALDEYAVAAKLNPASPQPVNNMAMILAASRVDRVRDGRRAVALALRANELSRGAPETLDTLAAAYAEAGRWDEALQAAKKAVDAAAGPGQNDLERKLREHLALIERRRPIREPADP